MAKGTRGAEVRRRSGVVFVDATVYTRGRRKFAGVATYSFAGKKCVDLFRNTRWAVCCTAVPLKEVFHFSLYP